MDTKLVLANICRTIARLVTIVVFLLSIPFLLFVGLQILSGEAANVTINIFLILLVYLLIGLIIAWWKEVLGASLTLVALVGSFLLNQAVHPGVGRGQDFSMLAGPINLLFALVIPGYHPEASPSARLVPVISWLLLVVPVALFTVSGWLRRQPLE